MVSALPFQRGAALRAHSSLCVSRARPPCWARRPHLIQYLIGVRAEEYRRKILVPLANRKYGVRVDFPAVRFSRQKKQTNPRAVSQAVPFSVQSDFVYRISPYFGDCIAARVLRSIILVRTAAAWVEGPLLLRSIKYYCRNCLYTVSSLSSEDRTESIGSPQRRIFLYTTRTYELRFVYVLCPPSCTSVRAVNRFPLEVVAFYVTIRYVRRHSSPYSSTINSHTSNDATCREKVVHARSCPRCCQPSSQQCIGRLC